MHCSPGRTPPRRPAFVGRLIRLVLVLLLTLTFWAGPSSASPCGAASGTRTLAGHVPTNAGEKECQPPPPFKRRGNADPISFAFFIGIIVAVLLVPVAMGRREDLPPQ